METNENVTKTFKIPITHLDYDYIEKCNDILQLEKIYLTLKAGEEGVYPDLENFCEEKLKTLSPNSRALRKATQLVNLNQLDTVVQEEMLNDFQTWVNDIQNIEQSLKTCKPASDGDNEKNCLYPIRNNQDTKISDRKDEMKCSTSSSRSCKPKNYDEWSKISIELEKQMILEEKEEQLKSNTIESKVPEQKYKGLSMKIDTANMSKLEKTNIALEEKEKGNEAFKSGDLAEAIIYYSRSLSVEQSAVVHNNRGLVYMKQRKWEAALSDLSFTLKNDPSNIKALQRRATCYSEIHNLPDAINDCQKILKLSPNNKFAENLLAKSQEELQKRAQPKLKDGKRMVITEIGSDDESSEGVENEPKSTDLAEIKHEAQKERQNEMKPNSVESFTQENKETSEQEFMILKDHGNQLFKEMKYDEALAVYDKLVDKWPSNPIGYRNRAATNLVLGRHLEVIEDCSIAIELDKDSHLSYYRRGRAHKLLKMFEESFKDFEMALKIAPNHNLIKEEFHEVEKIIQMSKELQNTKCNNSSNEEFEMSQDNGVIKMNSQVSQNSSTDDTIIVTNIQELETNQDLTNTWEFIAIPESINGAQNSSSTSDLIKLEFVLKPSTSTPMTKYEFDKKLNNIRLKTDWKLTIQLLLDAGVDGLCSLIGTKLDGFILENFISSLLELSKYNDSADFIKSVLHELVKVERFGFVKMMISDHAISELEKLFGFLKHNYHNLAEIDCLTSKYL